MIEWWQRAAIYQTFPRSFQDSDGDGEGDIQGIIRRLDYLPWLGIDAIWPGPTYRSPLLDSGYDVSDFRSVHPVFGSMQDFDALISEAHAHGVKSHSRSAKVKKIEDRQEPPGAIKVRVDINENPLGESNEQL
ncbi:alpha-amylase family glycosyl hydrolase [Rhizobium leguminosarum]|uniref:alpha-amylase family glycosyl hydrolase n=1 Tax=Rhizobium leguminosarum TaxID=384 RepID=UPI001C914347|nr:alpha-amylase family glycosyl hydrolase [Rhizobium leguminosarum]MBY2910127.1 alpha-amylase [Rhizobium leguminosarum]MBY2949190.1 alpha-amylase [Rhizobium leguminosarum]